MAFKIQNISNNYRIIILSIIIVLTAICFYQNLSHDFVNYDDSYFIYQNDNVSKGLSAESIGWAFTTTYMGVWHPITWLSHIIDCEIYGLNAGGHHLTSILFHLFNSILLFLILNMITGTIWRSALVALIFAIHPLHVESVSWIAVRKDLLSAFFVLLSIRYYIAYVQNKNRKNYLTVTLFFILALLSKPMVLFLPLLFILLDFWPLDRLEYKNNNTKFINRVFSLLKEKIIWFALSGLILIVNFISLSNAVTIASVADLSLADRILNVPYVIFFYLYKTVHPVSLSVFYPYPKPLDLLTALGGFSVVLILTVLLFMLKNKKRYLLFGWLWFLVGLLPVLGLVQQAQHLVADRYMYIPLIGLSIMIVWGTYDTFKKIANSKLIYSSITILLIIYFAFFSFKQVGFWKNSFTLFENALKVNENNHVAHANLGAAHLFEKNFEKAIYHYKKTLEIKPYYSTKEDEKHKTFLATAYSQLGNKYLRENKDQLALEQFHHALSFDSGFVAIHYNMGNIYFRKLQYLKAANHYKQAIILGGNSPDISNNLAISLTKTGEYEEAKNLLELILNSNQGDYISAYILACVYSAMDKPDSAVDILIKLVDKGFDNWQLIKNEPEFDNIRNTQVFLDFLKENNQE